MPSILYIAVMIMSLGKVLCILCLYNYAYTNVAIHFAFCSGRHMPSGFIITRNPWSYTQEFQSQSFGIHFSYFTKLGIIPQTMNLCGILHELVYVKCSMWTTQDWHCC